MIEPAKGKLAALIEAEAGAQALVPTADTTAKHWAAVQAALFLPPLPPPGAPTGGSGAAAAAKGGLLLKVVGGGLAAAAVAGIVWAGQSTPNPMHADKSTSQTEEPRERGDAMPIGDNVENRDALPAATPTIETNTTSPAQVAGPEHGHAVTEPAVRRRPAAPAQAQTQPPSVATQSPEPAPKAAKPGLAEELELVESIRRRLHRGDHAGALELAKEHREAFPDGALSPDRLDLEATATCASGRVAAGQELAAILAKRWPNAPRSDRLRTQCELP